MPTSDAVRHPAAELYGRIDSFVQARVEEARNGVPAGSDTARALDALQYLANRAAAGGDLLRAGVRVHPNQAVREARAEDAWETLRHIARRWHEHSDYASEYTQTWRDLAVEENENLSSSL
ncbi:hypothetical protein PV516_18500 [Streptomyces scabiei]|uniref:hypothetical protein n=1 Tax=Streptomyces scabiei TaxID=1930 RepID=UPI0029AE1C04|nr:hypothetical protein [Streptomyces scabiei]MDX3165776.1 hypothetical protein [Streptomyces scabiei]